MRKSKGFSEDIKEFILLTEGGYVNHPKDPGKATNMGITIATLRAWRGHPVTEENVRNLSRSEALEIYKSQYWETARCELLPLGLDYLVFDYAVNSGPARAVKDLQRTVGTAADGIIGQMTLAAIHEYIEKYGLFELFMEYAQRRWSFVQSLSTFSTFGKGWERRIWGEEKGIQRTDIGAVDRAYALAEESLNKIEDMPTQAPGKAEPEKPSPKELIKDPGVLTGVSGAVATVLGAIKDQPVLQVAAVVAVVGLIGFYILQRREADPT